MKGGNGRLADYAVRSSSHAGLERCHRGCCHRAEIAVYRRCVEAEVVKSLLKLGHVPARSVKRKVSIAESACARIGPALLQWIYGGRGALDAGIDIWVGRPSVPSSEEQYHRHGDNCESSCQPSTDCGETPASGSRRPFGWF